MEAKLKGYILLGHSNVSWKTTLDSQETQPENRQSESLNKSQPILSCVVLTKGELVLTKIMMMSENQSSWSQVHVSNSGHWQTKLRTKFK